MNPVSLSSIQLGGIALLVFLSAFLAGALRRLLGERWSIVVTAGGLGLLRLSMQLWWGEPLLNLILAMAATMLFLLFVFRDLPGHVRSDNGPEFTAKAIRKWLSNVGVRTLFIEPGSPWENGYIESLNGKLRDELLNLKIFTTLEEAKVLIEQWRREYNKVRPHSAKNYRPPAPEAVLSLVTT